jgi:hypothetical protein
MSPDNADVLCRISTGVGYAKRALRTDADQFLMRVCRPIILNGIPDDLADRGDLADRAIVLELPVLDENAQKFEEEFWSDFEAARPRILGALLDGVSGALGTYKSVSLDGCGRVRMADFARFAEAGCRALGFEEGEFLAAFVDNQNRAMRIAFNHDVIAQAVALLIKQKGEWYGNTKPLLAALDNAMRKAGRWAELEEKGWPKVSTWLGRSLRHSAPLLRKRGIEIKFEVDLRPLGKGDKDGIIIRKRSLGENSPEDQGDYGD